MSEKSRRPRRTPLKRKTGTYQQPPPQPDINSQNPYSSPHPAPQPEQERVVIVQQTINNDSGNNALNIITWPFRKLAGVFMWLIRTIIAAMIQSVVSFIMWTVILVLLAIFAGTYGFAVYDTDMNFIEALPLTIERIVTFGETLVGLQETAEAMQTPIPPANP